MLEESSVTIVIGQMDKDDFFDIGNVISLDDLKEDLESHKDGFDHDSYDAYLRRKGERCNVQGCIDFISDGLRWSHYDFS